MAISYYERAYERALIQQIEQAADPYSRDETSLNHPTLAKTTDHPTHAGIYFMNARPRRRGAALVAGGLRDPPYLNLKLKSNI